ncbi:hypothetical protein D1007_25645 [Hordeum vulgare]|nr:hypothetical protein D1007_25645 [Hordeum vulgare]
MEEAAGHQIGAKHGSHRPSVASDAGGSSIGVATLARSPATITLDAASINLVMDEDDERGCLEGGRQDSTVYCDGVQQASEDPEDQTALTSRLSVKHVVEVMQKFDDYKRWLVSEIGFEGMLNLPRPGKIDLRMSAWIMRKVKVKSRTIVIDKERVLLFALEDFHKIFGVPCGNRVVRGRDGEIKNTTIEFMKQTIGMNASPAHNLKVAENFITRDISEESSKIEKDCFQISFVIFVMGYVLSPGTKHEYMTIDFWGALANAELISQFNWCEYAVDNLMSAVMKVQTEYNNKAGTIHMSGCHLFFQEEGPSNGKDGANQQKMKRVRFEQNEKKEVGDGQSESEDDAPVYNNRVMQQDHTFKGKIFEDRLILYAQTVAEMVKSLYDNTEEESNTVFFASMEAKLPRHRDETGICMIHAIRQYDGNKMKWPLTKNDIASFRKLVAFEVFRLCDEHANFVAESVPRITFDEPGE